MCVSKSRSTRSEYDKLVAKLERELREVNVAIAAFERLDKNSSSKGKEPKGQSWGKVVQMNRRPRKC